MRGATVVLLLLALTISIPAAVSGQAVAFADPSFRRLWAATDEAVATGAATHAWVWGPGPITPGQREPYAGATLGERLVQYFDKGRMELNQPAGAVSSGLLARELMTGLVQVGDQLVEPRAPATIVAVGDSGNTTGPSYAVLGSLIDRPPLDEGSVVVQVVGPRGGIGSDGALARFQVRAATLVPETQHRLASVFRAYFSGEPLPDTEGQPRETAPFEPWYLTTGFPVTEAYWARVPLGGIERDVLVQAFERRVLTYTPSNPVGSQVEMGNVGQHYLAWRAQPAPAPLPDLACPSVPAPSLAGRDQDRLTVLGSALHVVGDRRAVAGLIRNDGPSRSAVEVRVSRFTADGRRLGVTTGFTDRNFWPNGQVAGFRVALPDDEPLANWTVEARPVLGSPSGGLAGGFTVEQLQGTVDGLGVTRVSGVLRYSATTPFTNLAMVHVYALDACGGLVTLGVARAGSGTIQPGSVTPFDAVMIGGEGASQLRAVVEARAGTTSSVADDALIVYDAGLFPAPRLPIMATEGCCQYTRGYIRPSGVPVRSVFRVTPPA